MKKGYKGFADMAFGAGLGEFGDNVFSISTTHGYQFNPYVFIGAGVALNAYLDYETIYMPIYADARFNFINKRISPFVSTKLGYSVADGTGLCHATDFGASFLFKKKFGLNVSMGYAIQQAEMFYYTGYSYDNDTEILGNISFKVGFEF